MPDCGLGIRHAYLTVEQAWRLLTNNLPAEQQAELEITAEPALVEVLRSTRAIIGIPK